jgi:hypothetical protein
MKPKPDESINRLQEQYLQAKLKGDTKLAKMLEAILIRIGAKVPR